ncbi:MAG: hypothetical protein HC850_17650 [Rhodomicrobium sp.]|nr:hypothetical protein [Rhodomicrobium sp.]
MTLETSRFASVPYVSELPKTLAANWSVIRRRDTRFYAEAEKFALAEVAGDIDGADLRRRFSTTERYWSGKRFELRLLREQFTALFRALFPDASLPFSTKLAIDTAVDVCRRSGCTPVIAYIPSSAEWDRNAGPSLYPSLLSRYAQSQGLRFMNGARALSGLGKGAYAKMGRHL